MMSSLFFSVFPDCLALVRFWDHLVLEFIYVFAILTSIGLGFLDMICTIVRFKICYGVVLVLSNRIAAADVLPLLCFLVGW